MATSLGSLVVSLGLDAAEFVAGLNRSQYQLKQLQESVTRSTEAIKTAFEAIGVSVTAIAFKEMVQGAIEAEAELGRLGDRAGLTGAELSSLRDAAALSHTGLEDVATMSARVSKALLEGSDSSSKAAIVLRALGVTGSDLAKLLNDPTQALTTIAKGLSGLSGGTQAAAQLLLVGRAGGTTSAFLKELAAQGPLVVTTTDAQVAAAKEFDDQLIKLGLTTSDTKQAFANGLLPTLGDVATVMTKVQSATGGVRDTIDVLTKDGTLKTWAQDAAIAAAVLAESLIFVGKNALLVGNDVEILLTDLAISKGGIQALYQTAKSPTLADPAANDAINALRDMFAKRTALIAAQGPLEAAVWQKNTQFSDALKAQFAKIPASVGFAGGSADAVQQRIDTEKANNKRLQDALNAASGAKAADPTKGLDAYYKALAANAKASSDSVAKIELDAVANGQNELSRLYDQGVIDFGQYWDAKSALEKTALGVQETQLKEDIDTQAKLVSSLQDVYVKFTTSGAQLKLPLQDRIDASAKAAAPLIEALGKLTGAQGALSLAQQKGGETAAATLYAQTKAAQDLVASYADARAQLLSLQGNTADASKLTQFVAAQSPQRKQESATAANPSDPYSGVAASTIAARDAANSYATAQARLNDAAREYGIIYDTLGIAQAKVDLQQQTGAISEIDALAQKSSLVQQYIGLLGTEVDKEKAIAAAALASGTPGADLLALQVEKASLALQQLGANSDLVKQKLDGIVADNLTTFLDNTISRTKSAKDAFADMAQGIEKSLLHLVDEDIAKRLLAALIPDSGPGAPAGDIISAFLKLFSPSAPGTPSVPSPGDFPDLPAAAGGSDYTPGGRILVGERGPEIVNLPRGSQVIPNNKLKGASNGGGGTQYNSIVVNVPSNTSRSTASQTATTTARELQRARARNG